MAFLHFLAVAMFIMHHGNLSKNIERGGAQKGNGT
jgi:hypothetical protein